MSNYEFKNTSFENFKENLFRFSEEENKILINSYMKTEEHIDNFFYSLAKKCTPSLLVSYKLFFTTYPSSFFALFLRHLKHNSSLEKETIEDFINSFDEDIYSPLEKKLRSLKGKDLEFNFKYFSAKEFLFFLQENNNLELAEGCQYFFINDIIDEDEYKKYIYLVASFEGHFAGFIKLCEIKERGPGFYISFITTCAFFSGFSLGQKLKFHAYNNDQYMIKYNKEQPTLFSSAGIEALKPKIKLHKVKNKKEYNYYLSCDLGKKQLGNIFLFIDDEKMSVIKNEIDMTYRKLIFEEVKLEIIYLIWEKKDKNNNFFYDLEEIIKS